MTFRLISSKISRTDALFSIFNQEMEKIIKFNFFFDYFLDAFSVTFCRGRWEKCLKWSMLYKDIKTSIFFCCARCVFIFELHRFFCSSMSHHSFTVTFSSPDSRLFFYSDENKQQLKRRNLCLKILAKVHRPDRPTSHPPVTVSLVFGPGHTDSHMSPFCHDNVLDCLVRNLMTLLHGKFVLFEI